MYSALCLCGKYPSDTIKGIIVINEITIRPVSSIIIVITSHLLPNKEKSTFRLTTPPLFRKSGGGEFEDNFSPELSLY